MSLEIKEFTKPLFSIPSHHFLFNPGNISPTDFMDTLQVEQSEYGLIKYPERGTCLYRRGNERYLYRFMRPITRLNCSERRVADKMSATVAAALKKIAAFILSDKELRGKLFVIIGSIVCGFLGLLCLPVVAIVSLGNMEIEPPEIDKSMFNEAAFYTKSEQPISRCILRIYRIRDRLSRTL